MKAMLEIVKTKDLKIGDIVYDREGQYFGMFKKRGVTLINDHKYTVISRMDSLWGSWQRIRIYDYQNILCYRVKIIGR
ncbi:MAG: hypothetical protein MUP55_03315 [Candidatus Aenigmarchaeota archaeon]|nr:hypothetical protein [Candidatus Aenigmarchaeota archaeon]